MFLLFLGCAEPTPDATAYVEAVRATRDDPRRAAEMCLDVGGKSGAECAAWAAGAITRDGDASAAIAVCDRIADLVWQDECRFLVAEETERRDGPRAAAARCHTAGRFTDKCLFHVWKTFATSLSDAPPPEAAESYASALAWADNALVVDRRLELRFWDTFFEAAFATARLDPARCDAYETRAALCRTVLPAALERRLNRSERKSGAVACPAPTTAAARADAIRHTTAIDYAPSADLDEVAMRYYGHRCNPPASPDPR